MKRLQRILCAMLALTVLFSSTAFAAEEVTGEELIEEEVHLIMATEERRSQWTPSDAIVNFIANQEGFRSKPHKSGGRWYVGYGTQVKSGQYANGISREKAMELLKGHIATYAGYLSRIVSRNRYLQVHQVRLPQYRYCRILFLFRQR